MVDHKSNAVSVLAAIPAQARRIRDAPLTESLLCANGESVWVHIDSHELMKGVYAGLAKELSKRYSVDDDSIQSDPHNGFRTVDFFGVWVRSHEKREPEELGIVSLFMDEKDRMVMKMNPAMPGAAAVFVEALGPALAACVERLPDPDMRITIEEGHDFRFK